VLHTESGADVLIAKVQTSATEDQWDKTPLVFEEPVLKILEFLAPTVSPPPSSMEAAVASPMRGGTEDVQPPILGQHKELEAALQSSSILRDHRALLGTTFNQFQSVQDGILEAFISLSKGFKVHYFEQLHFL
jgi:hypothetical protein